MKRFLLILVIVAFAVSSSMAKDGGKSPKCTVTLSDGTKISGYWIGSDRKRSSVGRYGIFTLNTIVIADTPDAETGIGYDANNAVKFVVRNANDSIEYLSLYAQKAMTMPKSMKHGKNKSFWHVVYRKNGVCGFVEDAFDVNISSRPFGGASYSEKLTRVYCYCLEGDAHVIPYWIPEEQYLTFGMRTQIRYSFERFPKVAEYIKSDNFKMNQIYENPIGFLDKVVELK